MTIHVSKPTALVVDDEFLISMMISELLEQQGIECVSAATADAATALLDQQAFSFAFIDFRIQNGTSEAVWNALHARKIPFAFCTGSAEADLQSQFPGTIVIPKPFTDDAIVSAALSLMAR